MKDGIKVALGITGIILAVILLVAIMFSVSGAIYYGVGAFAV